MRPAEIPTLARKAPEVGCRVCSEQSSMDKLTDDDDLSFQHVCSALALPRRLFSLGEPQQVLQNKCIDTHFWIPESGGRPNAVPNPTAG